MLSTFFFTFEVISGSKFISRNVPSRMTTAAASIRVRCLSAEAMGQFEHLEVKEVKPFVYSVALDRPDKRNALNMKMWEYVNKATKTANKYGLSTWKYQFSYDH